MRSEHIPGNRALRRPGQSGFGLLETLTGLVVFLILAMVGTKAFRAVVANQKETAQVKALTDAVTVTAERLSALNISTLTASGSGYLDWSAPEVIGSGEYHFRFRIVPDPTVGGTTDTTVVGLEVETGAFAGGVFSPNRSFATLIAPHLNSKDALGQVSTAAEREAEASFYASLRRQIADVDGAAVPANQLKLNSFNCYNPAECCDFMRDFFADPGIRPTDGHDEKCLYRCALGGAVTIKGPGGWNPSCRTDFCAVAPWRTREQCCAAIAAGQCLPGSVCASVCIECVGEDGSTCGPPMCENKYWDDFFDCPTGTTCDGKAIPDFVEGWGDVKSACKTEACAGMESACSWRSTTCCTDYWGLLNEGKTPDPKAEICKTISTKDECCRVERVVRDWTIYCGSDGKVISARNKVDGKWYCGWDDEPGWGGVCSFAKGCATTVRPAGAPDNNCSTWKGSHISDPWDDTYPDPNPAPRTPTRRDEPRRQETRKPSGVTRPTTNIRDGGQRRNPSKRGGGRFGSRGGRE